MVGPIEAFNFNPGTLAIPRSRLTEPSLESHCYDPKLSPIAQYQNAAKDIDILKVKVNNIWKSKLDVSFIHSATTFTTLLSYALALKSQKKYVLLTSSHEHFGGIQAFENLNENYQIVYLMDENLATLENFLKAIEFHKPDILFLSHICYDTGWELPISKYGEILKSITPKSIFIVDAAQSLGLINLPETKNIDVMFGSSHKWLAGPQGMGILWTSVFFRSLVKSIYLLTGSSGSRTDGFEVAGGRDFSLYASMLNSLDEYQSTGIQTVEKKTRALSDYFWRLIKVCFKKHNINCKRVISPKNYLFKPSPFLILHFNKYNPYDLYTEMNNNLVHVKCIVKCKILGTDTNILRIGIQHFESHQRISESISIIEKCLDTIQVRENHAN